MMMSKINNCIIYTLIIGILVFLLYNQFKKDKIVYVDNLELFSNFKMKTELEKKYKQVESIRKSILDSMYNEIRIYSSDNNEALVQMKREFLVKKETFDKENGETRDQYNKEIWEQINEYTKQFGDENGYDYVFGANGQGVLMYAKSTNNVTIELSEYINQKYNGK